MNDKDDFTDWLIAREECIEMSDLDDEEIKATRKLNGADKPTADEMFEYSGYKNTFNNYYEHDFGTTIEFKSKYKEILIRGPIDVEDLKAINKKVEELGWI